MSSRCGGTFTVQFLANGDQINVVRDVFKGNTGGVVTSESANLVQRINPNKGNVVPDWTKNPVVLCVSLESTTGSSVDIVGADWAFNNVPLNFANGTIGTTFAPEQGNTGNVGFYAKRSADEKYVYLMIQRNMASKSDKGNKQIDFAVEYYSGVTRLKAKGHFDIDIQEAGDSSFSMMLTANPSRFTSDNQKIKITAEPFLGVDPFRIPQDGYSIKWEREGKVVPSDLGSPTTLTLDETTVEGATYIVATLMEGNAELAKDGLAIEDKTDVYSLQPEVVKDKSGHCAPGVSAEYLLHIRKNEEILPNDKITYDWSIYNAKGVEVRNSSTIEDPVARATVVINPEDCIVYADEKKKTGMEHLSVDVFVTADIEY